MEENERGITESPKIDQEHAGHVQRCFLRLDVLNPNHRVLPLLAQLKQTGWNAKM